MANVTLYVGRGLRATISFTYSGPAVDLVLWWALVDGNGNPVAGPAADGSATGGAWFNVGSPTPGQQISAPADMPVNNGSIPPGTYRVRVKILGADWTTVYADGYSVDQVTVVGTQATGLNAVISLI